jgi:hypothetical protein
MNMEHLDRTALVPTVLFSDKLWEHYRVQIAITRKKTIHHCSAVNVAALSARYIHSS